MAYSIFEYTSRANPRILAERMYRQAFKQNKFAQWLAPNFIKAGGKEEVGTLGPNGPKWTGAPIEVHEEFVRMGKTDMDIPVRSRLTALPVYGDQPLKGKAERAVITFRSVKINRTRKAYSLPTGMSLQIVKKYADNLVSEADSYLRQWMNDYMPGNFIQSILAGYSDELVHPTTGGGRGQTIMSHPNFFVANAGQVSYSGGRPGTTGYEAAVEAAINGLTDVAACHMRPGLIKNLVFEAARKKIAPITLENGFRFYPVWLSDSAWAQMQNDSDFNALYRELPEGYKTHPLLTGAVAKIGGAILYADMNLWTAYTNAIDANVTAGTVQYGPRPSTSELGEGRKVGNWIENLDQGNIAIALLIGQSCLSVGVGARPSFTEQWDDHSNVKEVGIEQIISVVRNETFDHDGLVPGLTAGDFYENTASLAVATFSPFALSYS